MPAQFFPSFDVAKGKERSVRVSYIVMICENVLNADIWTTCVIEKSTKIASFRGINNWQQSTTTCLV